MVPEHAKNNADVKERIGALAVTLVFYSEPIPQWIA